MKLATLLKLTAKGMQLSPNWFKEDFVLISGIDFEIGISSDRLSLILQIVTDQTTSNNNDAKIAKAREILNMAKNSYAISTR